MTKYCKKCGRQVDDIDKYCPQCGNYIELTQYVEIPCFICEQPMRFTHEDGILGGNFYICDKCGIKLKETEHTDKTNTYTLYNSPTDTKLNKKYMYSAKTLQEWDKILNDDLSTSEENEYNTYKQTSVSHYKCPYCNINFKKYEKQSILTLMTLYVCDECKLTFQKVDNQYRFINYRKENPILWNNYKKKLYKQEWEEILNVEFKHDNGNRQVNNDNDDIKKFIENLKSANPLLPPTTFNQNLFEDDEKGLYKLDKIQINWENQSQNNTGNTSPITNGTLIITNKRIFIENQENHFNLYYNKIKSAQYTQENLTITHMDYEGKYIINNITSNPLYFAIEQRQHDIKFTPEMLIAILYGQNRADRESNTLNEKLEKVDINNANTEQISKLPILNLIQAKKIVQMRQNGVYINSLDDLKVKVNLNDSQVSILEKHIIIKPVQKNTINRRVDL